VKPSAYPFAAIVGQNQLKLVLLLAGVDWRLSVLLKGDKGSGKSTAARALAFILPEEAPFVNLPIGTTEDRLLGGLNIGSALQGEASLKSGLIHEAHGGVLYIDEINLLADALTDALLDVSSSGRYHVERDGFSVSAEAQFVLLGSMNIEEGSLRPQLLDRFALALDVETPSDPEERSQIIEARWRFDTEPLEFASFFEEEQGLLKNKLVKARTQPVHHSREMLQVISEAVADAGVRSMRADLAALRAARAHAALNEHDQITEEDVETVLPLVLNHRFRQNPPPRRSKESSAPQTESNPSPPDTREQVFPVTPTTAPEVSIKSLQEATQRGRSTQLKGKESLDVVSSLTRSFRNTGKATLKTEHLVFRSLPETSGTRFIFVVDSSGSHAARQRMSAVKGAIASLLQTSVDTKDEAAIIVFRGAKAEIVFRPSRDLAAALRVFEFLPTGGRTPLTHALELARTLVIPSSMVILVTDGRANVSCSGEDPWKEALGAAEKLTCPSLVVDSSLDATSACAALSSAMKARLVRLDDLNQGVLLHVPRS
jgi:magnesium chelatase subunit D